jgi:hypothetical protein
VEPLDHPVKPQDDEEIFLRKEKRKILLPLFLGIEFWCVADAGLFRSGAY